MRAFVTGGRGFLGKELVFRLNEKKIDVTSPTSSECDLFQHTSLSSFSSVKYDVIYHLAAWTQAGDFCLKYPGDQWINNQLINTNILSWWKTSQPQAKLVFMGTSCAYADGIQLSESNYLVGQPIESLYTYAMTKRMLYQGVMALSKQYGLNWVCAVPSTLYGPSYHTDGRQMHFIFDLIRKLLRAKHLGEDAILWGDGHQRRELVHVRSFVDVLLMLANQVDGKIINIGAGEDYSIRDYVTKICNLIDFDINKVKYDTSKYVGAKSKLLSIQQVAELVPDYSSRLIKIDEGLSEAVNWFYSNKIYLL